MRLDDIVGTYYAVVEEDIEVLDFPVVRVGGETAIYEDESDAQETRDGLAEVQGDRFSVVTLDVEEA